MADPPHVSPLLIWEIVAGVRIVRQDELLHFRSCPDCLDRWQEIKRKADNLLTPASAHPTNVPRTLYRGEINQELGRYESICCGWQIVVDDGVPFPECPNHPHLATAWKRIDNRAKPKEQSASANS